MAIIDDIRYRYNAGSMLMRFIYINIAVFLIVWLISFVGFLFNVPTQQLMPWIAMPADLHGLARAPWTPLTYMFAHYDLWHILFNMLWFYWLGRIFLEYFQPKQMGGLYILGGLGGAALYLAAFNLLPAFAGHHGYLIGASASVLAIVTAIAVWAPDYKINLLFIGSVSLKWVAIVTIVIDLLGTGQPNSGGHIAHLGGACVGAVYAIAMRHGNDITRPINAVIDRLAALFTRRKPGVGNPTGGTAYRPKDKTAGKAAPPSEADIDRVLDKIRRSGYASLTDAERELLFRASGKK